MTGTNAMHAIQPQSAGLPERIWWGAGTRATASQLRVEYNAHLLRTVAEHVAPAIGWRSAAAR